MKRCLSAFLLGLVPFSALAEDTAAAPPDLLRFVNGDRLDGRFSGMKDATTVIWKREDVNEPMAFNTSQLRQVVFRQGRAAAPLQGLSSVTLVNGDRIPGSVVSIDEREVAVDTVFAGRVVVPRDKMASLAPNPLGGKLLYHGPFSPDGWIMRDPAKAAPEPPAEVDPFDGEEVPPPTEEKKDGQPAWTYASGAWYHGEGSTGLVRDVGMPDRATFGFRLAWRSRLSLAVAFHADLKEPLKVEGDQNIANNPRHLTPMTFGNAYVLNLYSGYVTLNRSGISEEGKVFLEQINLNGGSARLPEIGEATIEIRCNRLTGEISLFVDGEFAMQWNELPLEAPRKGAAEAGLGAIIGNASGSVIENFNPGGELPAGNAGGGYVGKGGGIGFQVQGRFGGPGQDNSSPVRISDIVVGEWNGMPDAARSLQSEEQDIVLLTNGTDRFSGEVTSLQDGRLHLKGRYGDFAFPLDEVAEVRFAGNRQAPMLDKAMGRMGVRFMPFGRIAGTVSGGNGSEIVLDHPIAGPMKIALEHAMILEFKNTNSFLDDWDVQY
jgi:hypothetical protein